jgi:hypothetical protein
MVGTRATWTLRYPRWWRVVFKFKIGVTAKRGSSYRVRVDFKCVKPDGSAKTFSHQVFQKVGDETWKP